MQYVSEKNKSVRGNAIILILPLAVVVVAVIQLSLFRSIGFNKAITNFRVTGVRDNLVSNIKSYASMPTTFRSSLHPSLPAGTNSELKNCVLGGGASLCQADVEMPVALYYPLSSTAVASSFSLRMISGRAPLGGTSSPAALYDIRGNLCSTTGQASSECPFEVVTTFSAKCALGASSCPTAESITVHYVVKRYKDSSFLVGALRDSIDQRAPVITVAKILPGNEDSTTGNVIISSLTSTTNGTEVTPGGDLLAQITEAVKAAGIGGMTLGQQTEMAQAFLSAGYTNTTFITEMTKLTYVVPDTVGMITNLGQMGITDLKTATFLAQVGVSDPAWMQTVLDSGVTNVFLAGNLQAAIGNGNSELLAAVVKATSGLPNNVITMAIAAKKITDPVVAQQMYNTVAPLVTEGWVGWGLIEGGWYTDPARMASIITATAGIDPLTAAGIAFAGVTDPVQAQQLASIVSVLPTPWIGRAIIQENMGDLALTKAAVDQYMASISNTSTTTAPATASTSTTTTTTSVTSGTTGTSTTVTVDTFVSTCTTCSGITF